MKLYMNEVATTSRAVLALLAEENLAAECRAVDLLQGEHHRPEFAALNPNKLVPVLEDEGFVLTEASAILRYLATVSRSPLYPADLRARARVDESISWFEANFYKDFGYQFVYPLFFPHHSRGSADADAETVEFGKTRTHQWLEVLDTHFLGDGRPYLTGNDLTIADFMGASILSLGELVRFDLGPYPRVLAWYGRIKERPSWATANAGFQAFVTSLGAGSPKLEIPERQGPPPEVTRGIPHQQVSDNPDAAQHRLTKDRFLALGGTDNGPSGISVPGAMALFVPDAETFNPDGVMKGREFAHIHPEYDGSFHMVLDPEDAEVVLESGWGEKHPFVLEGKLPPGNLMVYAPRNEAEREAVMKIVEASFRYATLVEAPEP